MMSPSLFADAPTGDFSRTKMFDRANEQERLFGLRLDGVWMHVGTPDAGRRGEEAFLASGRVIPCHSGCAVRRDPQMCDCTSGNP